MSKTAKFEEIPEAMKKAIQDLEYAGDLPSLDGQAEKIMEYRAHIQRSKATEEELRAKDLGAIINKTSASLRDVTNVSCNVTL